MACRCLASLAEWERLSVLVRKEWRRQESSAQRELAPLAAHAAWHMGHWEEMGTFVDALKTLERPATSEVAFLQAVLHVRRDNHAAARGGLRAVLARCRVIYRGRHAGCCMVTARACNTTGASYQHGSRLR